MQDKILVLENSDRLCWKCLTEHNHINVITFGNLGYGSGFDGWGSRIQLCDECYEASPKEIWNLNLVPCGFYDGEEYEHENEMFTYIAALDIRARELVENTYSDGWNGHHMQPQDWIDYELDLLPHDRCKEYDLHSPDEINAYRTQFPTCQNTVRIMYDDKSGGSRCPFGACGQSDGSYDPHNIWDDCYQCSHYTTRTSPIRVIQHSDADDYNVYAKFKENLKKYLEKFGALDDETGVSLPEEK